MSDGRTLGGIAFGAAAGAVWGLVFLAPELVADFGPLQLTVGRYLAYGLIAAALLAPRARTLLPRLGRGDWLTLAGLATLGNTLYYVLLASAVQLGGIAMTSLVIGFVPVAVTVIGSREQDAVPLARLWPSLLLAASGAVLIGAQALAGSTGHAVAPAAGAPGWTAPAWTAPAWMGLAGLLAAAGALACWTAFTVKNSRALARLGHVSAHDWSLLIGVATGAQALLLLPLALLLDPGTHDAGAWARLAAVSAGVGLLASILGNALWNAASRLLPLTMVGQMILFETLFALLYGFLWEARWPTLLETAAIGCVVAGVVSCVSAHRPARGRGAAAGLA
jgi:drug/metabolite transporter (DMT)-like permease